MKAKKIPAYIIVIACKRLNEFKDISDILTDYLKGLPHIKKTSYGKNGNTDFYLIADTDFFKILYEFEKISSLCNILGFTYYTRVLHKEKILYTKYSCIFTCNSGYLPLNLTIPTSAIEIITKS